MTRISILGLTNYTEGNVWSLLVLPADVDRQEVIDNICMECAELGLVYTSPATMKRMIGIWSRKNLHNWSRILKALTEEYNPLHNYDRHEEWTDESSGSSSSQVAGYNQSAALADRDRADSSGSGSHTGHLYGNIGVTTSATMLTEEYNTRMKYTFMDAIVTSFKDAFCIQIY